MRNLDKILKANLFACRSVPSLLLTHLLQQSNCTLTYVLCIYISHRRIYICVCIHIMQGKQIGSVRVDKRICYRFVNFSANVDTQKVVLYIVGCWMIGWLASRPYTYRQINSFITWHLTIKTLLCVFLKCIISTPTTACMIQP